jgi:Ca2+-binding EF-hand superfamily protein
MKKAKATQASTMSIRRVINKLRTCTSKDFETTEQELNQILATDLVNCGAQMAKIKEEAETALKAAHDRIGLLRQKMAEAEQRKAEAEKKKAEAVEHAKELMKQLESMVEASEGAALVVKQKHEALQKEDIKFSVAEKTAVAMDEAVEAAKKCCSEASAFLKEQNPKMRVPGASENIEISKTISELVAKNSARSKEVDQASKEAKTLFAKIEKREGAKKKMNSITAKFIKYDKNKDSHFNKAEVKAYASGEFKFKVSDDALNSIFSHWAADSTKGIAKDSFQRVKMGIGLAREMARDAERKKARLEKESKLEKLKEESKEKIEELVKGIQEIEDQVKKPESYAQPLLAKAGKMEIAEMNAEADEVEKQVASAKEDIAKTKEAIKGLLEDCDEDLTAWMTQEVKKLELKTKTWDPRMTKASTIAVKLREMGKRKEHMELEALEAKALSIIRYHQQQEKLDFDALFAAFDKDKDEKVSHDEFVAFFADCKKPKEKKEGEEGEGTESTVAEDDIKKVFAYLDDDGEGFLKKSRFEAVARYRMKVVFAAPMTKELKSDSEEVRKLAKGEVVEVIEGPMEEPDTKTLRVKAKALKDDVEGYISVKSHTGNTAFLRDGGRVYRVVKETLITDDFDLDTMEEGKSRKLKVNEQVEVKEVPKKDDKTGMLRMRCKAKSDGRVGWATIQGNAGTVFMEAA